jgi:DNA-binding CsgD family transcriptional regulator
MDKVLRNALVSMGAALYWSDCLLILGGFQGASRPIESSLQWLITLSCFIPMLLIVFFLRRRLSSKTLTGINLIALFLAATAFVLTLTSVLANISSVVLVICSVITQGMAMGCLMQVWSLRFACTGVRDSISVVCGTTFLAVAFFLLTLALPSEFVGLLHNVFLAFSAVCSLLITDSGYTEVLSERSAKKAQWNGFWLVRMLYGIGIGFLIGLVDFEHPFGQVSPLAQNVGGGWGLILLLGIVIFYLAQRPIPIKIYALPCLPFVALGSFLICMIDSTGGSIGSVSIITAFICFMMLTSVQISNYRMLFGMRATSIAFSEKLAVYSGWTVFLIVGNLAGSVLTSLDMPIEILSAVFAGILIAGTVLALSRYSQTLSAMDYYKESNRSLRETIVERCHELAVLHKLTAREEEIICMLAMGRSGSYIVNELVISEGTFRTHSYRIYQKLGIHKNIELLDLVLGDSDEHQGSSDRDS